MMLSAILIDARRIAAETAASAALSVRFASPAGVLQTLCPLSDQMPPHHEQIGERTRGKQPIGILVQAAIAHLHEAEHALDYAEHMLDLRAHLRLGPVLRPLNLVNALLEAIAPVGEVQRVGRM